MTRNDRKIERAVTALHREGYGEVATLIEARAATAKADGHFGALGALAAQAEDAAHAVVLFEGRRYE